MAVKIFNATETEYTGTVSADFIVGNNLGNNIDGGDGDDVILGGGGDDLLIGGEGNDAIFGGSGNDAIVTGNGNNFADGGSGDDSISAADGNDVLSGGTGNDVIFGEGGDDILIGGAGIDYISGGTSTLGDEAVDGNLYYVTSDDLLLGNSGNDTFVIGDELDSTGVVIEAGISGLDNEGNVARYTGKIEAEEGNEAAGFLVFDNVTGQYVQLDDDIAEETETDVRLNILTRPGSTAVSTFASSIAGYNAVDTLEFTESGAFGESLSFIGIERIELASGVNITLSAEQLLNNGESLDLDAFNPGTHIYGVAGGPTESVTLALEYADVEFVPASTIVGASSVTYSASELQFDDYTVANLFHNVDMIYDASEGLAGSYVRIDGANESAGASETVEGSEGVDNATMRLGDDVYHGNGGNDLLIGHGGADKLYGDEGNDIFVIGGFGSGVQGTTSKADDGNAEWVAGDLIVGGAGVDTLRITTGIGANTQANGTIVLNNANFQSMEVVQVGGTVGRLNVENAALQLLNDHYYFKANGSVADLSNTLGNNGGTINNVVVDASGVTTNGLRFEGNANTQKFIGTTKADVFVGNGGNDTLTGGAGADKFVFGQVHEMVVTGAATAPQSYVDTAFNLTGVDTITDFVHNTDKIELHLDQYANLVGFNSSMLRVNATGTAADANDYLLFNTTSKMLSYDADGNGAGAAVNIAVLTGVTAFTASDVVVV
ncbi:MAG: calcium-binding protein [Methylophilus sp.]